MTLRRFLLALAATFSLTLPGRAADPPAVLASMPSSVIGFAHIRAQDVYKHDLMKGLRDAIAAAGPKALAAFDKQVYPSPTTIEGLTLFGLMTDAGPQAVGVIAFSEALDTAKVMKLHAPKAAAESVGNRTIYVDHESSTVIYFPDLKHVAISSQPGMAAYLSAKPGPAPSFAPAVKLAASKAIVIAANVSALPIPKQALNELPAEFHPLLAAERATVTVDLSAADPVLEARLTYPGDKAAADAHAALAAGAKMLKAQMAGPRKEMEAKLYANPDGGPRPLPEAAELAAAVIALGAMNQAEAYLSNPPIRKDGTDLAASVTVPQSATGMIGVYSASIGLMLPAVQKVREAAGRAQGQNNLKQIGLAMHNSHDVYGKLPSAAITDKAGKPLLSWRVAILPFIEQQNLYQRFKLDEPWDSEHNKALIPLMPKIYATPRYEAGEGKTVYKVFVGNGAMFDKNKAVRILEVTDGLSNTIMVVEGGEAVTWTKPEDIAFDPNKLPKLALPNGIPMINVLFGDGSVRAMNVAGVSDTTLKALITRAGGEVVDSDDLTGAAKPATAVKPAPPLKKD